MPVFAFIDTNVLLHYQFFRDVDWAKELGARDVTLVFALVVVNELDRRKWMGTRREKERAQSVLKALFDLGLSETAKPLRPGVSILAVASEPGQAVFDEHGLQRDVNDDRLLASLLAFRAAHQDERVPLVTADYGIRLKTGMRNVELFAVPDRLKLPDEPDEIERELKETRRQLEAAQRAIPEVTLRIGNDHHVSFDVDLVGKLEPERRARLLSEWREANPSAEETPREAYIPGGEYFLRGSGFMSTKEAEKHNAAVARTFKEYERFLDLWPHGINARRRCLAFNFVLMNAGSAPAQDVDIAITAEAEGTWLENPPKLPVEPEVPDRTHYLHAADVGSLLSAVDIHRMREDYEGPMVMSDDPPVVKYRVESVLHHVPYPLVPVYFQFQHNDAVKPLSLHYRVIAANMRKPESRTMDVKVTLTAHQSPPTPYKEPDAEK